MLRSEIYSGMCAKLCTVAASNNRDHTMRSLYYCLFAPHMYGCYSLRTSHSWWITQSTQRQWRGCNNIPSFLQRTALIAHSFCGGCTWHNLPHPGHSTSLLRSEIPSGMCAKFRTVAASNNRDHPARSVYHCLFTPHMYIVVLRTHTVHGESHNQCNANGEFATQIYSRFEYNNVD